MINQDEVNKIRVNNATDSNNEPLHTFKVKTKPRNMQPFKGSKLKRDSDIKLGLIMVGFALFVVGVLIYKGVL